MESQRPDSLVLPVPGTETANRTRVYDPSHPWCCGQNPADRPRMYAGNIDAAGAAPGSQSTQLVKMVDLVANSAGDKADSPAEFGCGFRRKVSAGGGMGHVTCLVAVRGALSRLHRLSHAGLSVNRRPEHYPHYISGTSNGFALFVCR